MGPIVWSEMVADLLGRTTRVYRKGSTVVARAEAVPAYGYPDVNQSPAGETLVDCHFVVVGVSVAQKELFDVLCANYPHDDRLAAGPSCLEVGALLGSQESAFRFFALGEALGAWEVITPASMQIDGEEADMFAGQGLVMCSGYTPQSEAPAAS